MSKPQIYYSDKEVVMLGMSYNCACDTQLDIQFEPKANIRFDLLEKNSFQHLKVDEDRYAIWNDLSNGVSIVNADGLEFIKNIDISKADKETLKILYERGLLIEKE